MKQISLTNMKPVGISDHITHTSYCYAICVRRVLHTQPPRISAPSTPPASSVTSVFSCAPTALLYTRLPRGSRANCRSVEYHDFPPACRSLPANALLTPPQPARSLQVSLRKQWIKSEINLSINYLLNPRVSLAGPLSALR